MASLAANLILHPSLSQSLAVVATTIGRDKVFSLIQYIARLVAWSLLRRGNVDGAARWEGLKLGMASARRTLRLFRPAEFLQNAVKLAARPAGGSSGVAQIAHVAQISRQIGYAGFFGFDMLCWLGGIQFVRFDKEQLKRFQTLSFRFWLFGILSSLLSSSASMVKLRADSRRFMLANEVARREAASEKTSEERVRMEEERRQKGRGLLLQRQEILSSVITDSLDVWIPATNLGYTHLNDGVLGVLGSITSYMALQKLWAKHAAAGARKNA